MTVFPGLLLASVLAVIASGLAGWAGEWMMGVGKSPVSPIMLAILLGIMVCNTIGVTARFQPGIRFALVRVLRLGIILLGVRLSLAEAGEIGLRALPVIFGCVVVALVAVTWLSHRLGLSARLGTLIAAGTGICGATAIVALAPAIRARDEETSYAVACVTLFGVAAMLIYPFLAHGLFAGDAFFAGLFLGTAVHETAQVAGAGLVYQQYFGDAAALDTATVTKLVRNLGILLVVPLLSVLYHRRQPLGEKRPGFWSMVPWFVVGFALMSLIRTVGDLGAQPFGILEPATWAAIIDSARTSAEICLAVAMAAVGLGTRLASLRQLGAAPLLVGLFSAVLVGGVSVLLINLLF